MRSAVTRRGLLRILGLGGLGGLVGCTSSSPPVPATACGAPDPRLTADLFPVQSDRPADILTKLLAGNARYVNETPISHLVCAEAAIERARSQAPPAMVLSCADSRVVPEILFDQPRSTLFVCRVAGNIYTDEMAGSLEYAVKSLGSRFLVVLGHSRCGAVGAAISFVQGRQTFPPAAFGRIDLVVERIAPAVRNVIATSSPQTLELDAVNENARLAAAGLAGLRPIVAPLVRDGSLWVVAARYDIETSRVVVL